MKRFRYEILIDDKSGGFDHRVKFDDFPELDVIYFESRNSLCPKNSQCVWEGDLILTLIINGKKIILTDHDKRNNVKTTMIDCPRFDEDIGKKCVTYEFQGIEAVGHNDVTYLLMEITKY